MAKKLNADEQAAASVINMLVQKCEKTPQGREYLRSLPDALRGDAYAIAADHRDRVARGE